MGCVGSSRWHSTTRRDVWVQTEGDRQLASWNLTLLRGRGLDLTGPAACQISQSSHGSLSATRELSRPPGHEPAVDSSRRS